MAALSTHTIPLILASGSPRRQELLASLGLAFEVMPSHVDEDVPAGIPPAQYVETLAARKTRAVANRLASRGGAPALVIGSDTTVVIDGEYLNKPADEAEAFNMLSRLQGRTHEVYTGLCVRHHPTGREEVAHSITRVTMRPLTVERIRRYVQTGEPMDKAGAYAIQGYGATIVQRIEGDYFTVVGLPVGLLAEILERFGVTVF
ncbi:MAG: Maf family protein [Alicyclobacillus macrosporangiidus]|uniref:Maf family protein n=1 Tax=Alicyclobacillus macrosporangiidus TaxID=392015 RepID=UPI0026ED2152|nr:Maf family protein [Alicyclobacillus macrosporangiidus]MCL6599199.1 Maf family protein [Alicyclobacillus macrosporangiidus]